MMVFANRDQLPDEPEKLKSICKNLFVEIDQLEEMLRVIRHRRFGSGSEQTLHPGMQSLFPDSTEQETSADSENESDSEDSSIPAKPKKRNRSSFSDKLPRKEIILDLNEQEKSCKECNSSDFLKKISEKVTEKLCIIPARAEVIRYIRPVFCCSKCETIKAEKMPPHPIPKCSVTTDTLAYILISKFSDGLPLYRMESILKRCGADISRDSMSRWVLQISDKCKKIFDLMNKDLNSGSVIQMDETYLQVLREQDRSPVTKSYLIVKAREGPPGQSIVTLKYSPSRAGDVIQKLLGNFRGHLVSDGLGVYSSVTDKSEHIQHYGCWQHCRRKFTDALKGLSPSRRKKALATFAVELINKLFRIENEAGSDPQMRLRLRREKSAPLIEQLEQWMNQNIGTVQKKSLTGKAMFYLKNQWAILTRFLTCEQVPIHNNFVENLIRPVAVGRKAWLFANSVDGANACATLYSLIVTAKINHLNLWDYLNQLLNKLPQAQTESELRALLPYS